MKKLAYYLFSFLFSFVLFLIPVYAQESSNMISVKVQPTGPLNPGESYSVIIDTNSVGNIGCQQCSVKVNFVGDSQALDTIEPARIVTNTGGVAYAYITSYVPENRQLSIQVISTEGTTFALETTNLNYINNPFLSVVNMVKKITDLGIPLPPMGNVYSKLVGQKYTRGQTRTVYILTNSPFGTKQFRVSLIDNGNLQFIKTTKENLVAVDVDAFKDVNIGVQACSTSDGNDLPCVGPAGVLVPQITNSEEASSSTGIQQNSLDLSQQEMIKKEQDQINNNPLSWIIKAVYSGYK